MRAPAYTPPYLRNQQFSNAGSYGYIGHGGGTKTGYGGTKTGYSGTKTGYSGTKTGYSGTKTGFSATKNPYGSWVTPSRYSGAGSWYSNSNNM